jgi:hypothetical protein
MTATNDTRVASVSANKYGYWMSKALPADPEARLGGAEYHQGSWWTDWTKWVARHGVDELRRISPAAASSRQSRMRPVRTSRCAPLEHGEGDAPIRNRADSVNPATHRPTIGSAPGYVRLAGADR